MTKAWVQPSLFLVSLLEYFGIALGESVTSFVSSVLPSVKMFLFK